MTAKRSLFAAVALPGASFVLVEMALCTVDARGADAAYIRRLVGLVGLGELGALLLIGCLVASLTSRSAAAPRAVGLAASVGVLLPVLHLLSNGLLPPFRAGVQGRLVLTAVALAAALVAGLVRTLLTLRRRERDWTLPEIVAGPSLLPLALLLGVEAAWRCDIPLSPSLWLPLTLVAGAAALLSGRLLCKRAGSTRTMSVVLGSLPLLALACGVTLAACGRSPFPELRGSSSIGVPDVLLIVLDTVRADAAPAAADAPVSTPVLAQLVADGQIWTHAFSTSAWTVPAHASLFTGLEADEHGSGWASPALAKRIPTLAEQFAAAGWRTGGFSANPYIGPAYGFDRGFTEFRQAGLGRKARRPCPIRMLPALFEPVAAVQLYEDKGGLAVASDALHFLDDDSRQPAFVFVNLLEAHLPYWPPERWLERVEAADWSHDDLRTVDLSRFRGLRPGGERSARELEGIRRLYAASVAHVDELVGHIVGGLARAGRLDRTVLVIVGDHGENLGEHGLLDHQLGVWDSLLRVPLIVRFPPHLAGGVRHDEPVSLADVAPALRALAGLVPASSGGPIAGSAARDWIWFRYDRPKSVLDLMHGNGLDPAPWDRDLRGVRSADRKWIEASDGRDEAYDLVRDPGEEKNLFVPGQGVPPGFEPLVEALAARRRAMSLAAPATVTKMSVDSSG
jgi:arylsulfatase A-like enzyme